MARTGVNEAQNANATNAAEKSQAFTTGQGAIGQASGNIAQLTKTGSVGADPWMSTGYLSNENKLQSEALDQSTNAGKTAIARQNIATGGLNGASTPLAIRDLSLQKGRLADQLTAERASQDFDKNVAYQQNLATLPLSVAGAESPYFSTATSGQDSSLNNLTQFGLASYGPWMAAIQAAGQAGSAAAKACWIAEALYGVNDWRTHLLRSWLNDEFKRTRFGRVVMALYIRFGERIAARVKKSRALRFAIRPLFEMALKRAMAARLIDLEAVRMTGGF